MAWSRMPSFYAQLAGYEISMISRRRGRHEHKLAHSPYHAFKLFSMSTRIEHDFVQQKSVE